MRRVGKSNGEYRLKFLFAHEFAVLSRKQKIPASAGSHSDSVRAERSTRYEIPTFVKLTKNYKCYKNSNMHTFGRHEMHIGASKSRFSDVVTHVMLQAGALRDAQILHVDSVPAEDEERGLAALDPGIGSASLVVPRIKVEDAYRAIVRDAFCRHRIPVDRGLDIGAGASGYMAAKLLPPETQNTWVQMELCPRAVTLNRQQNPGRTIVEGSYLRLREQGLSSVFQTISGLSSLDATGHIDRAVEEIRLALQEGGFLIHVQDTRPGRTIVHQELERAGVASPYRATNINDRNAEPNTTISYRCGGETVNVIELFRRRLERALKENGGYDILESDWVTAVGRGSEEGKSKHSELGVCVTLGSERDSIDTASAVVTVARRK